MFEQILMHEVPVALVMITRQAEVFVHVEGNDIGEGYLSFLVQSDQFAVDTDRRRTCRKTQYERSAFFVLVDPGCDILCSPFAHLVVVVLNYYSHCLAPSFVIIQ